MKASVELADFAVWTLGFSTLPLSNKREHFTLNFSTYNTLSKRDN